MSLHVSVVVPVFNPGSHIEDCIASLLRQSMPDTEYEAIFVDDGSTDATPARLDQLAAEHPHMRVIHQENSGWSGKPRNVGAAAARGEYVFFVDNDDWLGDEALERMYAFAERNESDIVIGKMAGLGRGVPRELFRKTYDKATLDNAPLIDSLTPHKMFRKEFLDSHELRFPEEKRRLEDHVFITEAFFLAETISVYSDYVCYYHVRREDASNAGFQRIDPKGYFSNLGEALDVVERYTEPGPLRDKLYRRWFRVEMIERMRAKRLLRIPAGDRQELFDEIRNSAARFGPGVGAGLPPTQRVIGSLIQADRLDDLVRLANWEEKIGAWAHLDDIGWHDGSLRVSLTAELRAGDQPVSFVHRDGRDLVDPPLSDEAKSAIPDTDLEATSWLARAKVDLLAHSRESGGDSFLPVRFTTTRQTFDSDASDGSSFRLLLHGDVTIDPRTAANGEQLGRGIWDFVTRITCAGWSRDVRLGAIRAPEVLDHCEPAVVGSPARAVVPYWTDKGNLSVDIEWFPQRLTDELVVPTSPRLESDGDDELVCTLPLRAVVAESGPAVVRFDPEGPTSRPVDVPAELTPAVVDGRGAAHVVARFTRDQLATGRWTIRVRLTESGDDTFASLPVTVTVPANADPPAVAVLARPGRTGWLADKAAPTARNRGVEQMTAQSSRLRTLGRKVHRRLPPAVRSKLAPAARQVLARGNGSANGTSKTAKAADRAKANKAGKAAGKSAPPAQIKDRFVEKPTFVLCSVRSGSTLLRVILNSHSKIHAPHELHLRSMRVKLGRKYAEKSIGLLDLDTQELEHLLWDRVLYREVQRSGKSVIVEKTPANASFWPRLQKCWPDARFIFLLRHPGSIYESFLRARTRYSDEENLKHIVGYLDHIEKARANVDGLTVKYEELTTHPEETTRALCSYLGVPWEESMLEYGKQQHGPFQVGVGDWSKKIKSGVIQPVGELPKLEELPEQLHDYVRAWGYAD